MEAAFPGTSPPPPQRSWCPGPAIGPLGGCPPALQAQNRLSQNPAYCAHLPTRDLLTHAAGWGLWTGYGLPLGAAILPRELPGQEPGQQQIENSDFQRSRPSGRKTNRNDEKPWYRPSTGQAPPLTRLAESLPWELRSLAQEGVIGPFWGWNAGLGGLDPSCGPSFPTWNVGMKY